MGHEELIEGLSQQLRKTPRHAIPFTIARTFVPGALLCFLLVLAVLGVRPDFHAAFLHVSFWMKWSYTLSMAGIGLYLCALLARPVPSTPSRSWLVLVPVGLLAITAAAELARSPSRLWLVMLLGGSWKACPLLVLLLSIPFFAALAFSFRSFAPTQLRAAGAAVGLAASTSGAVFYCLHCPEVSALFVLSWYSLGFATAAGAGAIVGPRILRW